MGRRRQDERVVGSLFAHEDLAEPVQSDAKRTASQQVESNDERAGVETGAPFIAPASLAEVAIPVPLRQLFSYAVPASLASSVHVGSRVAVPFGPRKVAGFVVRMGPADAVPSEPNVSEKPRRLRALAGVLEDEPLFPPELLAFLVEAADYYLHPLGEVLRAAAPPMSADALRRLRAKGFLRSTGDLAGKRVASRTVLHATLAISANDPGAGAAGGRLGPKQRAVLEALRERGELTHLQLDEIVQHSSAILRALAKKGLVSIDEREHDPFFIAPAERDVPPEPSAHQREAIDTLAHALSEARPGTFLLHGVTGSGKTEVYLRLIAEARARGRGALVLVPEIALTPQLVNRFRARFGDAIAVLHSALTDGERHHAWHALRRGTTQLAIGARSALFAPVKDLGVIVVDEEHDPSFKQEEGFRYHARDLAMLRAHRTDALCVVGSATPSIETFHAARSGRIALLSLPERAMARPLPRVELVDLKRYRRGPSGHSLISLPLHRALERCLAARGQAILFLNRRGFSPTMRCKACGDFAECPACSVALTEHRREGLLRCHYCDFAVPVSNACQHCGELELEPLGLGTERLEDAIAQSFPGARVDRLDRDTAAQGGVEAVLERMRKREVDVLVGTQMVTKGHDLPGVTLVGVVLADQSLAFPDFRAQERTFQLLAQVAGRAGRGEDPGEVILQTFQPEHPAIALACRHDYLGFFDQELDARRELRYAPFSRLVAVRVDAVEELRARNTAEGLAALARSHPAVKGNEVEVLGPAPAPIARLRARHRFRFLLRGARRKALRSVAAAVAARIDAGIAPARASVDVDPVSML